MRYVALQHVVCMDSLFKYPSYGVFPLSIDCFRSFLLAQLSSLSLSRFTHTRLPAQILAGPLHTPLRHPIQLIGLDIFGNVER